jgi:hypothetical protein
VQGRHNGPIGLREADRVTPCQCWDWIVVAGLAMSALALVGSEACSNIEPTGASRLFDVAVGGVGCFYG